MFAIDTTAQVTVQTFTINTDRVFGRQYFMNLEELPADASADMRAGYAEAEAEYDDFARIHNDRFNGDF